MEANSYTNVRTHNQTKTPKAKARKARSFWLVVALFLLSAIPLITGAFRLNQLANGAAITPENARFFWVLNLAVAEWIIRARPAPGPTNRARTPSAAVSPLH